MDEQLRRLSRATEAGALLKELVRSGRLSFECLELAAYLGHTEAQLVACLDASVMPRSEAGSEGERLAGSIVWAVERDALPLEPIRQWLLVDLISPLEVVSAKSPMIVAALAAFRGTYEAWGDAQALERLFHRFRHQAGDSSGDLGLLAFNLAGGVLNVCSLLHCPSDERRLLGWLIAERLEGAIEAAAGIAQRAPVSGFNARRSLLAALLGGNGSP